MRFLRAAMGVAVLFAAVAPALADDIDQATLDQVRAVAVKGYAHPEAATIRNIKKSLATNGSGYCGEISVEGEDNVMTAFHVLLDTPTGPTVLRLAEFPDASESPQAATVHDFFVHVGCIN